MPDQYPVQPDGGPDEGGPAGQAMPPGGKGRTVAAPASSRRRLRGRVLDWVIGALVTLSLLLLALLLFWLSITRPVGSADATPSVGTPMPSAAGPSADATPPSDLAEDEVWLGDISLEAGSIVAAGTPLLDVVGTGTDVTSGPDGLVARHLDLTATVPFHVVAAEIGPDATLSAAGGGEVRVDTRVEALGRSLPGAHRPDPGRVGGGADRPAA
ncbi:hypothetical protein [Tessaracoccus defluvii]|uniref:Uncharacterized protein n=1 Tax=Tessaracoccus defluvii TaxID=1285901 RepID=A0A7H0H2U3_9ACTN|nr:hypothetical protein [Tessaracoccus defluvii]QNP54859.1 hypothetical protein H9L22_11160 [Tessaracoccus defluvii]